MPEKHEFKVWKTIKLGTGLKTGDDFCIATEATGGEIDDYAKYIMDQPIFTVSNNSVELDLVAITAIELGFINCDGNGTCQQIYDKAQGMGLLLCPAEVGPQLRLQYMDQSTEEEWLLIGMKFVPDPDGRPCVFLVDYGEDKIRRLSTLANDPNFTWGGPGNNINTRWIFVLPHKS